MPLNNEKPSSTSSVEDQGSDVESSSEVVSDLDCSRDSFNSDFSSKHCTPSSSPPKSLTLDEVMDSARDIFNLKISHEIVMNPSFHMDMSSRPQNRLFEVVRDNMHKAFWDMLKEELSDDPPKYQFAIKLLEEIREILLSFLNPGANRMRTQIMEVLDMDLIRQQADNNAVDIQGLASFIINTMGKLCAPVREEEIKKLRESTDNIVILLKEIFRVIDLMRVDHINFSIELIRPFLQKYSVEYEREKFQKILEKTPTALNHTTAWIQAAKEELSSATVPTDTNHGVGKTAMLSPFQLLNTAFLHILRWDYSKNPIPETLVTDETRLQEIQWQLNQCQAVNEVMLIVYNTVGEPIQGLASLSDRLKRMISVLLNGMHKPDFKFDESLEVISAQICCELNKSLTDRSYPALTPEVQTMLTGQICSISQKDNPIRTLVEDRVQQYFSVLLSDSNPLAKLEQVPAGLTPIKAELGLIARKFISLVNYNRTIYGPFYAGIIKKLLFSNGPSDESLPRDRAQDSACQD
ncbi:T-complex protein 11-like protein 2 [Oryzias latipes]|uniref:T-complex 11, testis-specific-like 2 n=1 Tax=Oryzias latipes TaxID=8090 RepID=H2MKT5_ORYLA|nr:T-complex protein 11-like protein 2 [Oryzias latipes]XP_011489473.1 T-complex protein 11-like protein 2 [Oryzias latipes]XP_023808189.1 T-complex protein 11-like protein 2 [Oryzias latipes]